MFFEMFYYWQAWFAIVVIIGGVKLLDLALGAWRNYREDVLYQQRFEKDRLSKLETACFGCAGPVLPDGQPSMWRQLRNVSYELAAYRDSLAALGARIDRIAENAENRNTDTCKLIDKKITDIAPILLDHARALDNLTASVKSLREGGLATLMSIGEANERIAALETQDGCKALAEKPVKATAPRPAPAKKAGPVPIKKPTTTITRRSTR